MSINDRITKKWKAMMLSEHFELLEKIWQEDDHKVKPILHQQQIADMELKLQCALHNDLTVEIKYYNKPHYSMVKGKLVNINSAAGTLRVGEKEIGFGHLLDVYVD